MENIESRNQNIINITKRVLMLVLILIVFLVSLNMMSGGFKLLGKDIAQRESRCIRIALDDLIQEPIVQRAIEDESRVLPRE